MKAICRIIAILITCTFALNANANYKVDYYPDIWITTYDNFRLSANVLVPQPSYPGETFPAIVFINSWGMDKDEYLKQATIFADKGYVVLSYASRGWFASEGVINTAGPNDMRDISSVIDNLLANYPVDANNIGLAGISYGGGMALLGLAHDSRVKTAVSMSGWANLWQALFAGETPRALWTRMLINTSEKSGNPDPILKQYFENLLNYENIAEVQQWTLQRSVASFVDQINQRTTPTSVFICNNLEDELFPPNSMIDFYQKLQVRKKIDLNLGSHTTAELGGIFGLDNAVWKKVHAWFDHELHAANNGVGKWSPVTISVKLTDNREDFPDLPLAAVHEETFFMLPRGNERAGKLKHVAEKIKDEDVIRSPGISGMFSGVPLVTGGLEGNLKVPVYAWLPLTNHYVSIYYQTDNLPTGMQVRGTPHVRVPVKANNNNAQLIAYMYDVDSTGLGKLITYGPVTLHNITSNKQIIAEVEMVTTSYDLPANHSLAIGFDTYELQFSPPTLWPYHVSFMQTNNNPGILSVPVL